MKQSFKTQDVIKIQGVLIPADWNDIGAVMAVSICTHREEEYAIDPKSACYQDLLQAMQQEVELKGHLTTLPSGGRMIRVQSFSTLRSAPLVPMRSRGVKLWRKERPVNES